MAINHLEKLSTDYLELLNDQEDFNVIINVGESPNAKIFRAHSNVLRYRSLYFRDKLANTNKDTNNIKTINISHVTVQQFEIIVKYIYGGVILLENQEASFIFDLMLVTCEFLFEELTKSLETHMIEEKSHWLHLHFDTIYQKSFQNKQFRNLQEWCNDFLVKHPNKIFASEDFISLKENALVSLIKRDDLQMEEVTIWDYIIKWGIAQTSGLSSGNLENWTSENFLALQNTLQNCLPHIRYFQISGDDIIDNVQPYHQILNRNLWNDIMKRAVNPSRQISSIILPSRIALIPKLCTMEPFSTIISEEHAAEIATWIDKKTEEYLVKNNPYEFKLLLRGTRDGFTKDSFWQLCDKQENTIVVMKVKDTDEILGGYSPIKWDKSINNWVHCKDSFIFSLKNGSILSSILSRVKNPQHAIYSAPRYGPWFGGNQWIHGDLAIATITNEFSRNYRCLCYQRSYEKAIRSTEGYFPITEYEVFRIQRK